MSDQTPPTPGREPNREPFPEETPPESQPIEEPISAVTPEPQAASEPDLPPISIFAPTGSKETEPRPEPALEPIPAAAPEPEPVVIPPPPPVHEPVKAASLGTEKVKPKKRVFLGDNKFGRFMRGLIRVVAAVVGLFALGVLAAYILLFRPMQQLNNALADQLATTQGQLDQTQADLDRASAVVLGLQNENEQLVADAEKLKAQVGVEQALNKISEVILNLEGRDTAAARVSLNDAEALLDGVMPTLTRLGVAQEDTLNQLFELVRTDLSRNSALARQDLDRLTSELLLITSTLSQ